MTPGQGMGAAFLQRRWAASNRNIGRSVGRVNVSSRRRKAAVPKRKMHEVVVIPAKGCPMLLQMKLIADPIGRMVEIRSGSWCGRRRGGVILRRRGCGDHHVDEVGSVIGCSPDGVLVLSF